MLQTVGAGKSRVSQREHLEQVEKTLGRKPAELEDAPRLRPELFPTWSAYCDIKAGCETISYQEIRAYIDLVEPLAHWEIRAIRAIERARLAAWSTK